MPRGPHRQFYPNARRGQNPRNIKPIIKADPVITADGVKLTVMDPERSYTPDELKSLAKWLYSLSHEAVEVAASGYVSETKSYDVTQERVIAVGSTEH